MTKKELIEFLEPYPDDMVVAAYDHMDGVDVARISIETVNWSDETSALGLKKGDHYILLTP